MWNRELSVISPMFTRYHTKVCSISIQRRFYKDRAHAPQVRNWRGLLRVGDAVELAKTDDLESSEWRKANVLKVRYN
jgi:hypothetical protein